MSDEFIYFYFLPRGYQEFVLTQTILQLIKTFSSFTNVALLILYRNEIISYLFPVLSLIYPLYLFFSRSHTTY